MNFVLDTFHLAVAMSTILTSILALVILFVKEYLEVDMPSKKFIARAGSMVFVSTVFLTLIYGSLYLGYLIYNLF